METQKVVSFSGGKDSTALILHLQEKGEDFQTVFCDTGWEHPATYKYVQHINKTLLKGGLITLKSEGMADLVKRKLRVPSAKARFCTTELKIKPMFDWILSQEKDFQIYQGIRADESNARSKMKSEEVFFLQQEIWEQEEPLRKQNKEIKKSHKGKPMHEWEHFLIKLKVPQKPLYQDRVIEWLQDYTCDVSRPLFNMTAKEVFAIHKRNGVESNPLYKKGAGRVGCFPCIMVNIKEMKALQEYYPEIWENIKQLEEINQRSFFPPNYIPKRFQTGRDENGKSFPWYSDVKKYLQSPDAIGQISFIKKEPLSCMSIYNLCE